MKSISLAPYTIKVRPMYSSEDETVDRFAGENDLFESVEQTVRELQCGRAGNGGAVNEHRGVEIPSREHLGDVLEVTANLVAALCILGVVGPVISFQSRNSAA